MTIEMVQVINYVRKKPGSTKDTLVKELKITLATLELALVGLQKKELIELKGNQIYPK